MASAIITLDEDQAIAVEAATTWINDRMTDPKVPQVFRIGGPAGSGKTTIIRAIVERFPELDIAVTTLAGKAADVLRNKGLPDAVNLHRLFYQPMPEILRERSALEALLIDTTDRAAKAELRKDIEELDRKAFLPREEIPHDLIIVDEASMIGGKLTEDLKRYGRPILAVGDPHQLPPVEHRNAWLHPLFDDHTPDVLLTGNHRYQDAPLVAAAADAARIGVRMPDGVMVDEVDASSYDVALVFKNESRWKLIKEVREARGKPTNRPVPGDEILVWRNDRKRDVFNGTALIVDGIQDAEIPDTWDVTAKGVIYPVDKRGFMSEKKLREAVNDSRSVVASFPEALTVHKAQGSEYDRVLVAEAPSRRLPKDHHPKWWYTAVTRARSTVHVAL